MRGSVLALSIALVCAGCFPIPRYSYLAKTRVEVGSSSTGFSDAEVARAQQVVADVAKEVGMKSDANSAREVELQEIASSNKNPALRFLSAYYGTISWGSPIRFRLEISPDRRVLYYSIFDRERGTASPMVARIRKRMMEQVEAAFPDAAIVHEAWSLGPFFDTILDAHHAVQPPSTGMIAPVT